MNIFVSGTDTDIGKTVISSWLALHLGYSYFKPIQTGSSNYMDSSIVSALAKCEIHKESYVFKKPLSPHLASVVEIDLDRIIPPSSNKIVIEGAGGVLVPINKHQLIPDLITKLGASVVLVAGTKLCTINHTLLRIEALKSRGIELLGVVLNGESAVGIRYSIEHYGGTQVLFEFPHLPSLNHKALKSIPMPKELYNRIVYEII